MHRVMFDADANQERSAVAASLEVDAENRVGLLVNAARNELDQTAHSALTQKGTLTCIAGLLMFVSMLSRVDSSAM